MLIGIGEKSCENDNIVEGPSREERTKRRNYENGIMMLWKANCNGVDAIKSTREVQQRGKPKGVILWLGVYGVK